MVTNTVSGRRSLVEISLAYVFTGRLPFQVCISNYICRTTVVALSLTAQNICSKLLRCYKAMLPLSMVRIAPGPAISILHFQRCLAVSACGGPYRRLQRSRDKPIHGRTRIQWWNGYQISKMNCWWTAPLSVEGHVYLIRQNMAERAVSFIFK